MNFSVILVSGSVDWQKFEFKFTQPFILYKHTEEPLYCSPRHPSGFLQKLVFVVDWRNTINLWVSLYFLNCGLGTAHQGFDKLFSQPFECLSICQAILKYLHDDEVSVFVFRFIIKRCSFFSFCVLCVCLSTLNTVFKNGIWSGKKESKCTKVFSVWFRFREELVLKKYSTSYLL